MPRPGLRAQVLQSVGALALLSALVGAGRAQAQSTNARVRMGAELPVLVLAVQHAGLSSVPDTTRWDAGLGQQLPALNLGYGVGRALVLGLRFGLGSSTVSFRDGSGAQRAVNSSVLELRPYLELDLGGRDGLQPFAGALLSLQGHAANDEDGDLAYRDGMLGGGVLGGLRVFVAQRFAFEPGVRVEYAIGQARAPTGLGHDVTGSLRDFRVLLTLGFSLWLGGDDTHTGTATEAPPAS